MNIEQWSVRMNNKKGDSYAPDFFSGQAAEKKG